MKVCSKCKKNRELSAFHNKSQAKDGKSSWCKVCSNKAAIKYYKDNPDKHKKARNSSASKNHSRNMQLVIELTGLKCIHCGFTHTTTAPFDWHHINPEEKEISVSSLMWRSNTEELLKEIDKCLFLCSCCHRIEHERLKSDG